MNSPRTFKSLLLISVVISFWAAPSITSANCQGSLQCCLKPNNDPLASRQCTGAGCCTQGLPDPQGQIDFCQGPCPDDTCYPNDQGQAGCGIGSHGEGCHNNKVPKRDTNGVLTCVPCPGGQEASGGKCVCASDSTMCGDQCVDTDTDMNNCGGCGNRCLPLGGHVCDDGKCTCPPGQPTECSGKCVNTDIDSTHCGGCGYSCRTGRCLNGTCTETNAPEPSSPGGSGGSGAGTGSGAGGTNWRFHVFPHLPPVCQGETPSFCDGKCTNLSHDRDNCGACGRSCNGGYLCIAASCLQLNWKKPAPLLPKRNH